MAVEGENLVAAPCMKLEKMLSMKGGYGESSYVKNSQAQARHARSIRHLLEAGLDTIRLPPPSVNNNHSRRGQLFTIADLGCSCGANTLSTVDAIIRHLADRHIAAGLDVPEFQAFFSDLPSNDFNVLFHLLPPLYSPAPSPTLEDCLSSSSNPTFRPYFAAGVPGSFYRRLFPTASIDVFHSAFSLHWLSQVPPSVADRRSGAYNRGKVFVHGAPERTANAYRDQFKSDLAAFLQCRAEEMKAGGAMFLVCLGRSSQDPADQGGAALLFGTHFEDSWDDMVQENLVEPEKRDDFNLPLYAANLPEFKEVVEANGSFTINHLELVRGGSPLVLNRPDDAREVGKALANGCRSVCGVLVEAQIGEHLSNKLFERLEQRGRVHARDLVVNLQFFHIVASLSLS